MAYKGAIKLLSGSANEKLGVKIAQRLGLKLSPCTIGKFKNNETSIEITESVRGEDVFILG